MVTGSKGMRSRTRRKLKKGLRSKFRPESLIKGYKAGDKVIISIDPSSMRGMPHARFIGKAGIIQGMKGNAFAVNTYIGKKKKEIYISPEHLKKI
jgi:large subunit ribosomal protein L21e